MLSTVAAMQVMQAQFTHFTETHFSVQCEKSFLQWLMLKMSFLPAALWAFSAQSQQVPENEITPLLHQKCCYSAAFFDH